ncbi:hypothetical protein [Roseateles asaccharophilus]|uniref:Uncharacterized protein n=1 Tax=Roseateles asaccharophilus TaxID=582607 RepID=A0ABU2ABI7_9BURK|nr:hypothetical protein [Roseateles asaccharophilus]MDR7334576.1 hypothetical protein [Roseateles asaccharophilus]
MKSLFDHAGSGFGTRADGCLARDTDPLLTAVRSANRAEMERLAVHAPDADTEVVRLQRLAETAWGRCKSGGRDVRYQIVAWPFLANFPQGGRVPAQFDMGSPLSPTGKLMTELWSAMLPKSPGVHVLPLRLGLHAHTLYSVAPDIVQRCVASTANAIRLGDQPSPSGLRPIERDSPFSAYGLFHAPVLLQAIVATPGDEPVSFVRDRAAVETARQLVASKLSLPTATPRVLPLMPSTLFDSLESTLRAESLAMALWRGPADVTTAVTIHYDAKESPTLHRSASMWVGSSRDTVSSDDRFDVRWMRPAAIELCIAEGRLVAGNAEAWMFYQARTAAGICN